MLDETETDYDLDESAQDPMLGDINAVSADDPVGLYFRQMAQEPLLSAAEEVDLAKRIEYGKLALEILERRGYRIEAEKLLRYERLIREGQPAREHLGRANTRLVVASPSAIFTGPPSRSDRRVMSV